MYIDKEYIQFCLYNDTELNSGLKICDTIILWIVDYIFYY